ncbi:MAG TPA: 50S ribosomal protein L18e [Candidatus Nanoarchaeia archaeon]|nr:50S ribosomal protein L18e [Candidatus Nanoarchaeia archaeon]
MITKTAIKTRIVSKTNPILKQTISAALKDKSWLPLAKMLSGSTKKYPSYNLSEISELAKDGIVVIPGKVLGSGALTKKVSVYALSFSSSAQEKLSKAKIESGSILDLIEKNKKATGVQVLS